MQKIKDSYCRLLQLFSNDYRMTGLAEED